MDVETSLIAKAISTSDIDAIISRGIEPDHFADELISDIYDYCINFKRSHKSSPSMAAVRHEFPGFKPKLSPDPLSYHIDRFVHTVKERKAIELVRAYHDCLEDPSAIDDIEIYALEMARELTEVVPAPLAHRLSDGMLRKQEYERRKREGIKHGLLMGIPTYDQLTEGGLQPHELLIFGGPPGSGKTTSMQNIALSAYLQMTGKPVLFISLEVEGEQILRKFDVMLSQIRYRALKALELNVGEEERWTEVLERCERERMERDIIIRDDIRNCTATKVEAETTRYKPGLVVVDYLEEMRAPRNMFGWEGVQENGRGLKQSARVYKIPHVTGTQINRDGDVSYQSTQKISDIMIVLRPDDEDAEHERMEYMLMKYRDGPSRRVVKMRWSLETMDIREEGFDERFPARYGLSLDSESRRREHRLSAAMVIGDRSNPFLKSKQKGENERTKKSKRSRLNRVRS
jgi:replicative DNA helicase